MWRALLLVAAMAVSAPAQPITQPAQVAADTPPAPPARTSHATKKPARAKAKPTATKKTAGKTKLTRRAKSHHGKASATKVAGTRVAAATPGRITVEEQSAQLRSVGRVRYADNMPPGFSWPATEEMAGAEHACEQELDARGIEWQHADAVGKVTDPIVVPSMMIGGIPFVSAFDKGPFEMDCQLVRMLARIAPDLSALGVRAVTFGSIYRNTLVRFGGVTKNVLSRHALGLAMDIKSFTAKDGRVVEVETEYPKHDPLLLAIEDLVDHSKDFRILLTPKNDPISHKNHFHLEASVDFRSGR